tara:strand:- start:760 stop:960 length:201 start_codon:yes stop_codon:yes gene_type:complete
MKVKELIKLLEEVENKEKYINLLGNQTNGENEEFDVIFNHLEVWNDGDESITLFLAAKGGEVSYYN